MGLGAVLIFGKMSQRMSEVSRELLTACRLADQDRGCSLPELQTSTLPTSTLSTLME